MRRPLTLDLSDEEIVTLKIWLAAGRTEQKLAKRDRMQPMLPFRPRKTKRFTHTYTCHGTTCLLAALLVHHGDIEGRCVDRHAHEEFLGFLKHLYRKYPNKDLHVIVDNYSAHKHRKVMEWA